MLAVVPIEAALGLHAHQLLLAVETELADDAHVLLVVDGEAARGSVLDVGTVKAELAVEWDLAEVAGKAVVVGFAVVARPSSVSGAPGARPWPPDPSEPADARGRGLLAAVPTAPRPTRSRNECMSGGRHGRAPGGPAQNAAATSSAELPPPGKYDPSRERAAGCGRRAADRDGQADPRHCSGAAFLQLVR